MLVFVVPKHNAHNNKYISVPANSIAFPENKETESIGISTPKVIFEIFKEEELKNQANEILNQLDEKKKLDELFKEINYFNEKISIHLFIGWGVSWASRLHRTDSTYF